MRMRVLFTLCLMALLTACDALPPVVYVVVTATPGPEELARQATRDSAETLVAQLNLAPIASTSTPESPATQPTAVPSATATLAIQDALTLAATTTGPTPLPAGFPTPVMAQVTVAEQLFEGGRMFWIQPTGQIWVMTIGGEGFGKWTIYADDYVDTEPALDPALTPPEGRYQPERGFGKLWREADDLRTALGWGITPEFGYVSRYEYRSGGTVDPATGAYTPGPGVHVLFSLGGELFRFNEADSTWRLGEG